MASQAENFNLNKEGSKLTSLTNPVAGGKISFLHADTVKNEAAATAAITNAATLAQLTGIVIPITLGQAGHTAAQADAGTALTGAPWYDPQAGYVGSPDGGEGGTDPNPPNQIGDPAEKNYSLTPSDLFTEAGVAKDGSAQKLVNAILDSAYVSYNSGVLQGKGLSSMTVSRGDLTLTNSAVTDITGIENTYSRSYGVVFKYKQKGFIQDVNNNNTLPDIENDLTSNSGGGPF